MNVPAPLFMVPPLDRKAWPTLGPQICDWIEEWLVFGPGDLLGQPAKLDEEKRALIYRAYEVHPKGSKLAGRRRFHRVGISLRKGSAKTEFAAWLAIGELHPDAPVRCVAWDRKGNPIGGGVVDPYIPMVAYTEEQSEELAFGAMRVILEYTELAGDFDIGLERIIRRTGDGKAQPLATAPNSRDGARTTFQHFDETQHMISARLKKAHRAMLANIPKRKLADAWSLETTTAPAPGEVSVAEETMAYALEVHEGRVTNPTLFFFHRQATDAHDLTTVKGIRSAVREASGPVAAWSDLDRIVEQWKDPTADRAYLERVWLNRLVKGANRAFDVQRWDGLAAADRRIPARAVVTLGFDGARYRDATGLVATEVETGLQEVLGVWERPEGGPGEGWQVPEGEVNAAVEQAFERFDVWRLYADPPYWESTVANWSGRYGDRVVAWPTNRWLKVATACRAFLNAMLDGTLHHDGNAAFRRHVANAQRRNLTIKDDQGGQLWVIQKDHPDSPNKIDLAMAGILSWAARTDALSAGVTNQPVQSWEVVTLG